MGYETEYLALRGRNILWIAAVNTNEHGGGTACPGSTLNKPHQKHGFITMMQSRERCHQTWSIPMAPADLHLHTPWKGQLLHRNLSLWSKTSSEGKRGKGLSYGLAELRRISPLCGGSSACSPVGWRSCLTSHCCPSLPGLGLWRVSGRLPVCPQPILLTSHAAERTGTGRMID